MTDRSIRIGLVLLAVVAVVGAALPASADSGSVKVDRQEYSQPTVAQADPCQSSTTDICVSTEGGATGDAAYLHFELSALPPGATPTGLTLALTPDAANTGGNANSGSAVLQACVLTQAIQATFSSASPPAFDCQKGHADGKLNSSGAWSFELAPLVRAWQQSGYSGAAIVPVVPAPPVAQAPAPVPPPAWSVAFGKTRIAATATYTPAPPVDETITEPVPAPILAPLPPGSLLPEAPLPVETPATLPSPVVTQHANPPIIIKGTVVRRDWLLATLALGAAAVGLLMGASAKGLLASNLSFAAVGRVLATTGSRMASPVAILAFAALLALGSVGAPVLTSRSGGFSIDTQNGGQASQGAASAQPSGGPVDVGGPGTGGVGNLGGGGVRRGQIDPALPTLKIGVTINNSAQKVAALLGVKLPAQGNLEGQVQIMVDYINTHGGVAGHKVIADEIQVDTTSPDPAQWDKVCTQFTEDDHVFAAFATTGNQDTPFACYAQHKTLLFNGDAVQIDNHSYQQMAPYVWIPSRTAEDQAILAEIEGLQAQAYFTPTTHLGVVIVDQPEYHTMWDGEIAPRLASLGYQEPTNLDKTYIKNDATGADAGQTVQELQQAAVQFNARGVNHVIFMMPGGGGWLFFWEAAEQQQYHPLYGYSSNDEPYDLQEQNATQGGQNAGANQFKNSMGVGFFPAFDTGKEPFPDNDAEARCLSIYKAGGQVFGARLNSIAAEGTCNSFLLLQRAATGLTESQFTRENVGAVLGRLAASYQSPLAVPGGTRFLPGRPEGTDYYRWTHFDSGCNCFVYTSSQLHQMPY